MNIPWLVEAYNFIGLAEIKGPVHKEEILQFWKDIKRGGIKNDETPWCAAFVGAMLERAGIHSTRYESASSYSVWGIRLPAPKPGCIVVFKRSGGGHVGFVVGITDKGLLQVLGGNQSDAVNIKEFTTDKVVAYRWPSSFPVTKEALTHLDVNSSVIESMV
jgi:uncharacterized protein (TIGR02594 family)